MKNKKIILTTQFYEKKEELLDFMNQFDYSIMCPKSYTIEECSGLYRAIILLKRNTYD